MKTFKLYICILLLPFLTTCSNNDMVKEEAKPIKLNKRVALIDHINPTDCIKILEGNGGYKITIKDYTIDKEFEDIPFENHTRVYIEDNKIIAERILLKDFLLMATCILTDSEGVKKTFIIENTTLLGIHDFYD